MAPDERKSILFITLSNIGDVILTTPVIRTLRSRFPNAKLTVVVGPKAAGLLEGSRQIDRVLVYNKRGGWGHKLKLVRALREEFYEYVVDLRNSAFPFLVRAENRSPLFRPHRALGARERHLEVLQMMKLNHAVSAPFDFFSQEDEASLIRKLEQKGFRLSREGIVVAPGAGDEAKRWPIEGFQDVVARFLKAASSNIFVVGDQLEMDLGRKLSGMDPNRVFNLTGEITLRELAALVASARLVLTNDSACMHLGHELDRPVVALFGPTDHQRYGRESEKWRIVRAAPPAGLNDLPPEAVFRASEGFLQGVSFAGRP